MRMKAMDQSKCPLCGEPNSCAQVGKRSGEEVECWCGKVSIPESVLANIPVEARGKTCVCRMCAENSGVCK